MDVVEVTLVRVYAEQCLNCVYMLDMAVRRNPFRWILLFRVYALTIWEPIPGNISLQ